MVQPTDELKFKDSSTVKRPERILCTALLGCNTKTSSLRLTEKQESVLKFDTFQSTRIVDVPHTVTHTFLYSCWTLARTEVFFPHPVADLIRSIYAIQQCSLSLPLRLDLLPSITNVMFSLPRSFLFLFILMLCFFSHTALWLFTHFSSSLPAWGKWAYR